MSVTESPREYTYSVKQSHRSTDLRRDKCLRCTAEERHRHAPFFGDWEAAHSGGNVAHGCEGAGLQGGLGGLAPLPQPDCCLGMLLCMPPAYLHPVTVRLQATRPPAMHASAS